MGTWLVNISRASAALSRARMRRRSSARYGRVSSYFRPVKSFNIGKKGEYHERLTFKEGALGSRAATADRLVDSYEEFRTAAV